MAHPRNSSQKADPKHKGLRKLTSEEQAALRRDARRSAEIVLCYFRENPPLGRFNQAR